MGLANWNVNATPEQEREERRAAKRFRRMTRAEVAEFMRPLGFEFDAADDWWSKGDAFEEYLGVLNERSTP